VEEPYEAGGPEPPEPAHDAGTNGTGEGDDAPDLLPPTLPSRSAFLLAFISVVIAGVFGGIIGYGLVDVGCTGSCETPKLAATIGGAMVAAGGVGIVAVLVLRAMAEWKRPQN
jgi:hypothetical protein